MNPHCEKQLSLFTPKRILEEWWHTVMTQEQRDFFLAKHWDEAKYENMGRDICADNKRQSDFYQSVGGRERSDIDEAP